MSAAMFTSLHKEENTIANGWRVTRWRFFFIVWTLTFLFLFYFLPGLLMPVLSCFSVVHLVCTKEHCDRQPLWGCIWTFPGTFDRVQIAYIGSPLLTPFWAAMNVVGGLVIVVWIIAPIAYYSNLLYSSYMPILSSAAFDNTGHVYDVIYEFTSRDVIDRLVHTRLCRQESNLSLISGRYR